MGLPSPFFLRCFLLFDRFQSNLILDRLSIKYYIREFKRGRLLKKIPTLFSTLPIENLDKYSSRFRQLERKLG